MGFSPKYEEYGNKPKPEHNWTTPAGTWVGIWGGDWGDLLLRALARYYPDYECEVWRPDLRADKVYSVQFEPGFVHRCFPAAMRRAFRRCKIVRRIHSQGMIDRIRKYDRDETVFFISAAYYLTYLKNSINRIDKAKVLYYNFLNTQKLLPLDYSFTKPLRTVSAVLLNGEKAAGMRRVKNLLTASDNCEALAELKRTYPQMKVHLYQMAGLNLDFWKPVMSKNESRALLGIALSKFVIVLSQRLVPEYQIDRFLEVINRLNTGREFVCYITGHGLPDYEAYLHKLASDYRLEDKVCFVGYVSDEELRNYFIAADLFATTARMFAGSTGAEKCMAIGTPILHVTMGSTYEILKTHNAGVFIDPENYDDWASKLSEIIDGEKVHTVPREIVEDLFSPEKTADDLHNAIMNLRA